MTNQTTSPIGEDHDPPNGFRSQLPLLLMLTSIFFINFLSRIVLAPLLPTVEAELSLSHSESGSFFMLISMGYFITLLCSGYISSRLTHRRTIVCSNVILGTTLICLSFSTGLWAMRLGMIALGMAAGPYIPSGIAVLTAMIPSGHWGKALSVHELAPNLSFVLAPFICELLLTWFSWRSVFLVLGFTALLLAGVFARFGRGGHFRGRAVGFVAFGGILSKPAFWILAFLFCLGASATLGVYTMMPLFLVNAHGMERQWANTFLALSRVLGLPMALIGGWATDRFGTKVILKVVFLVTGGMTLLMGLAPTSWVTVAVFLQPVVPVCFFPAGLAALSLMFKTDERNIAVSLMAPFAFFVGGGLVPTLIGWIGDAGSFGTGMTLVGIVILSGTLVSGRLR